MKLYRTGRVAEMLGVHKVIVIRWTFNCYCNLLCWSTIRNEKSQKEGVVESVKQAIRDC